MGRTQNKQVDGVKKRAEGGAADAQLNLGLMYSTGQHVPLDYIVAHKWFNLAALNGNDQARLERKELAEVMSATDIAEAQRLAREWKFAH